MVAEVNLYWVIYQNCSKTPVDIPGAQEALNEWRLEWKFLFGKILFSSPFSCQTHSS